MLQDLHPQEIKINTKKVLKKKHQEDVASSSDRQDGARARVRHPGRRRGSGLRGSGVRAPRRALHHLRRGRKLTLLPDLSSVRVWDIGVFPGHRAIARSTDWTAPAVLQKLAVPVPLFF
jgi:hypothetical protein